MNPIEYWHNTIGQYICDLPASKSDAAVIPQRTLKGLQNIRLGNIDAFYIATEKKSFLIGRIELPCSEKLELIPTEKHSARKFVANWLLNDADGPFLIGVIGLANAASSMRVSHHPSKSYFCQANAGFEFNLEKVRKAQMIIKDFSWKKEIAPAIHLHHNWLHAEKNERKFLLGKLNAMLNKMPELRRILSVIDIRPNSGEYQILSWFNIDVKSPSIIE